MTVDLVIVKGRLILGDVIADGGVAAQDGIIVALGANHELPDGKQVIDAQGSYILPGIIDPHVHLRDPGLTDREDFETGTIAAAIGGVTTVFDMPNTAPPTADAITVEEKRAIAKSKAKVDFGIFGLVGQENVEKIDELAAAGVIGFKFFSHLSIGKINPVDDGALLDAFERIAPTGLRALVHAQNAAIIKYRRNRLQAIGRNDVASLLETVPSIEESGTVEKWIAFAQLTGVKLHVCHVTTGEAVDLIRNAKRAGIDVTCDTCPHYLWFTQEDIKKHGTSVWLSPPFRLEKDRRALWDGLRDGTIDMVASDHAPQHQHDKECNSVWDAKSGLIGVETSVPLMITAISNRELSFSEYIRLASENPARVFGLWPRKGNLAIGTDADVTVVRTDVSKVIKAEELHSKSKNTPFNGMTVNGEVTHTIVRGHVVMQHGKVISQSIGLDACLRR